MTWHRYSVNLHISKNVNVLLGGSSKKLMMVMIMSKTEMHGLVYYTFGVKKKKQKRL